jgi:predicted dehydrogenase
MLDVGLIGLGPEWEHRYRPALAKLKKRLRIRSLYTPVITHAEQVSAELDCDVASGLMALFEREDVRALLVLDAAWYSGVPAEFACRVGKPAYLAGPLTRRFPVADHLLIRAAETGVTLMPDFGHRYTPATSRLRELTATRLGRPLSILVDLASPTNQPGDDGAATPGVREALAAAIDWCSNLVGTAPGALRAEFARDCKPGAGIGLTELYVEFRRPAAGGDAATACIRLCEPGGPMTTPHVADEAAVGMRARVQCVTGTAWLEGPRQVTWEAANEKVSESLIGDRPDVEVMLDHFSRRVVGGLIPVPTLEDLYRACQLVDVALDGKSGPDRDDSP